MNKKISSLITLLLGLGIILGSCSDDDNKNQVSQEWIDYQKSMITKAISLTDTKGKTIYTALESDLLSGRFVYHRPSEFIKNNLEGNFDKKGPNPFAIPQIIEEGDKKEVIEKLKLDTDIAVTRYHAWYYNLEGEKYVFDTSETANGAGEAVEFIVGQLTEGFKMTLYDMKVGEERIVCIPHSLAYGTYDNAKIPGYTTLFFDIKLMEIKR